MSNQTAQANLIGTWPVGSPEWYAAREGKMTGSKIAVAMGISPYDSPFALWHREKGQLAGVQETPPMEWGTRLEPAVIQKFKDNHPGLYVWEAGTWVNRERPWQTGNPDGLIHDLPSSPVEKLPMAILEVKCARYDDGWGEPGTDQIPVHYRAQVLWYMDTLGIDLAYIAVLISGADYREYVIRMDDTCKADIQAMRVCAELFLDSIHYDERPDIDTHGATYEAVKELHPDINPETVTISDHTARSLIFSKREFDTAERLLTQCKSVLADEMGNAHVAKWQGHKLADRRVRKTPGATPYMQLANKLPDEGTTP